jgi:hypothetical protein
MAWTKGQSGNPAGRPRLGGSFAEKIRRKIEKHRILDKLVQIANDTAHPQQIQAIRILLEHGYGKPVTPVHALGQHTEHVEIVFRHEPLPPTHPPQLNPPIDVSRVQDDKVA